MDFPKTRHIISGLFALALTLTGCSNTGGNKLPKTTEAGSSQAVSSISPHVAGSSVVAGSAVLQAPCVSGPIRLAVVSAGATIYDTIIAVGGTYEFHVTPGVYQVIASTAEGCRAAGSVTLQGDQIGRINLSLTRSTLASTATTQTSASQASNSSQSQVSSTDGVYACPWWVYGCQGYPYPGAGGGVVGKPNVYLSAVPGTRFQIKLRTGAASNLLAATPALGQVGWHGEVLKDSRLMIENASHRFLYYDMRIDLTNLQSSQGFCVAPGKLVPMMVDYLRHAGFESEEIKDFEDYWSGRMPMANESCVYPQEPADISPIADLEVEPRPDIVTRVWFFIVPQVGKTSQVSRFFAKPPQPWSLAAFQARRKGRAITSVQAPSHDGIKALREWGVGFLISRDARRSH